MFGTSLRFNSLPRVKPQLQSKPFISQALSSTSVAATHVIPLKSGDGSVVRNVTRFEPVVEQKEPRNWMNDENEEKSTLLKVEPREQNAKFKKMAQRRQSAPSIVIRGVLGKSNKLSSPFANSFGSSFGKDSSCDSLSTAEALPVSLKFGSHGAVLNLAKRTYVMEGKVLLTRGLQTQERYLFLFTDLLLIAKAKSGSNYKLKSRVRVCELWTATCLDDVSDGPVSPETSFVIGWPTTNYVATFSSQESKDLWYEAITKRISIEKEKESPKSSTISTIRRDEQGLIENNAKSVTISHKHSTRDVLRIVLSEFNIEAKEEEYQLWTMCRKDVSAYPLIGHEYPHAVHMSAIRDTIANTHPLYERDVTCLTENDPLLTSCTCEKYQFILRRSKQIAKINLDQNQGKMARIKSKTPTAFFSWARKRHLSSRSSENNALSSSANYDSCESNNSTPGTPKLFSRPLKLISEEGEIPPQIEEILRILYRKGPHTTGIFRKSAAARTTKLLKDKLNESLDVDLREAPIHVLAALLKNFLRNIPDSLLDCARYDDWSCAIDKATDEEKMQSLTEILTELDLTNRILLRRICALLNKIASNSENNSMTVFNLSVCIAPSILWTPPTAGPFTLADSSRKVAEILQFILHNELAVFNKILNEGYREWSVEEEKIEVTDDEMSEPENVEESESSTEELTVQSETEIDQVNEIDSFNRSRHFRRQLQRRKPVLNKPENVTILSRRASSSLDSLDLLEVDVPSSVTSTSNDSGFTTLSGEDDDVVYSTNSTAPTSIPTVANTGLNLSTSVFCSTSTVKPSNMEDVKVAAEELRNLWSPDFSLDGVGDIFQSVITSEQEMVIFDEDESRDIVTDFEAKLFKNSPRNIRRFSDPCRKEETFSDDKSYKGSEGNISESDSTSYQESCDTPAIVKNYLNELRSAPTKSFFDDSFASSVEMNQEYEKEECAQNDENNNSTSELNKTSTRPSTLELNENIVLESGAKTLPKNITGMECHDNVHSNHTTACLDYRQHHQTTSLPRKAHSMREGKDGVHAPKCESVENCMLSPIQKLTLNLHSLPDFRAKSKRNKDSPLTKRRHRKSDSTRNTCDDDSNRLSKDSITSSNQSEQLIQTECFNKSATLIRTKTRSRRSKFAQLKQDPSANELDGNMFSVSMPATGWARQYKLEEKRTENIQHKTYNKVFVGTKENSVREKVQAFNLLISDQAPNNNNATYVSLDSILDDYGGESKIKVTNKGGHAKNSLVVNCEHVETSSLLPTKSVNIVPPVSDGMLHTLSESFAFGNRKSPRNLTPLHTPGTSPSVRRRDFQTNNFQHILPSNSSEVVKELDINGIKTCDDVQKLHTSQITSNGQIFNAVEDESYV